MAIFQIQNQKAERIRLSEFKREKDLQALIENNLETIFNCRFIATEFSTGNVHAGRIDTLALSEDNNPVIIEYKKIASSELINQSLYYLHWITDHRGDFQVVVNKVLGEKIEVDWSEVRVICIAPEYKKFDLHAAQVMGANIELWQYKFYDNGILNLEEVYRRTDPISHQSKDQNWKNPTMVEAGRKAAETRRTGLYKIEDHISILDKETEELFNEVRDYIVNLDASIEETPKKLYISYKTSQNFVCLQTHKNRITLFLKIDASDLDEMPRQGRDVKNIGHFGTGDFELTLKSFQDFEETKHLINTSLKNIGG